MESIARLLDTMAVSFPRIDIQMAKRDIGSAFRLLRLRPSWSLLMCTELPGCFLGYAHDLVLIYRVIPFGLNGAPGNFAIFGDAATCIRAKFGMGHPDWFPPPTPLTPKPYVDDGRLFEIRNAIRQNLNATLWGHIAIGMLGRNSPNLSKLEEEGKWKSARAMLGFDIDARSLTISLTEAKIAGARVLFDNLNESKWSSAIEVVTLQKARGHFEHFKAPNAIWTFPTGPIELPLRYTEKQSIRVNFPVPEACVAFWGGLSAVSD